MRLAVRGTHVGIRIGCAIEAAAQAAPATGRARTTLACGVQAHLIREGALWTVAKRESERSRRRLRAVTVWRTGDACSAARLVGVGARRACLAGCLSGPANTEHKVLRMLHGWRRMAYKTEASGGNTATGAYTPPWQSGSTVGIDDEEHTCFGIAPKRTGCSR